MVSSAAKTVPAYLEELLPERREVVARMRAFILEHLPPGYVESMAWGMLCYSIPLTRYPDTYNGQPLAYVCLAAQKNNYTIYLTGPYMFGEETDRKFRAAFAAAGKKIDMGKSCLHFKRVEDLALEAVGESIAGVSVDDYIRQYEKVRAATASGRKAAAKKGAPKKAPAKAVRGAARKGAAARKAAPREKRGRG
jgi:hypothetical protein